MAESLTTKKELAKAIKKLAKEKPIDKISIGEICSECNLNRKSFYYHFKDKFDLINWIFDTEFLSTAARKVPTHKWQGIEELCSYLYENKCFYKKAIRLNDANSFGNHLKRILEPLIKMRLQEISKTDAISKSQLEFYTDAFIFTIARWLLSSECLPPDEFMAELKSCIYMTAIDTLKEFENNT